MMNTMLREVFSCYEVAAWGIAELPHRITNQPNPIYAITFGLEYDRLAVEALPEEEPISEEKRRLATIAHQIYDHLTRSFHVEYPSEMVGTLADAMDVFGICDHDLNQKHIAALSGIGWIGKSSLLVNPEYGPRLRLGTFLTTANVMLNVGPLPNACGSCTLCIKACPAQAINGDSYIFHDIEAYPIDRKRCEKYTNAGTPEAIFCGLCMKHCPIYRGI
jgi:epoxyqueuosine reductase QueG